MYVYYKSLYFKSKFDGIFRVGVEFLVCFVCRRYLKMVCFLGSADDKVFLYDFVFGDIMLFGSVYCITI